MKLFHVLSLVAASFLLPAGSLLARSIVFTLTDGTEVYYRLSSDTPPVLRLGEDDQLSVNADGYTFSQIRNFRLSETDDPNADGVLSLPQGTSASPVLYDLSGHCLGSADLNRLSPGIYLLKTGNAVIKIQKK